ncbi:MAG: CaiB/BaiF CoA-transferase family protein [Hyphomicrobiales bacterium]|nr:CaiB/BaiF CoA-transferase family protein [Hyphomicrobiales bacterium]
MSDQPLSGLKVLDFTTLVPGPLASLILVEAGAEVVKIERPEGEYMRHREPRWGEESAMFALLNRGKRSLALDLKAPGALKALEPLIGEADILLEQFRPGVMDRLGLGYERCRAINPRLIYCSISGYGQRGPKAREAGHDVNFVSEAGHLSIPPEAAERRLLPPPPVADIGGGTLPAVINILLALISRQRSGKGAHLDIAMCDGMFLFSCWGVTQGLATGIWPKPGAERLSGGSPRYQVYPTKDKRFVAAGALEDHFWANFCAAIGLEERYRDDDADPQASIEAVRRRIAEKDAEHWRTVFADADCCCCIVATLEEAVQNPHFRARGLFDRKIVNEAGAQSPSLPLPLADMFREPPDRVRSAPALGADNDALLKRS